MSPGINTKDLGESFNVDLYVDTKTERASASDITVTYNPAILRANSVTPGDFLPVVLKTGVISSGTITLALGVNPTDPKMGVGKLATINFTPIAYGSDTVNYMTSTELAVISQTGNFISSLTGTIVTVVAPTPTPTLTPIPSLTPLPTASPIPTATSIPTSTPIPSPTSPWSTPVPTEVLTSTPYPTNTPHPTATSVPATPMLTITSSPLPTSAPPTSGSVVVVYAAGTKAGKYPYYPNMKLIIKDHTVLQAMAVSGNPLLRQFVKYTYNSPVKVTPMQVRVSYTNDYSNRGGDKRKREDRNLMVDKIEIDGVAYETEASNVYTKYSRHTGCHSGFNKTEWLYCNGYFAY
jgi:hypothetical protein